MNATLLALWLITKGGAANPANFAAVNYFADFEKIYAAAPYDFPRDVFSDTDIRRFSDKDLSDAKRIYDFCKNKNISVLTYFSNGYPDALRYIDNPPTVLFCDGSLPDFFREPPLTVIGSRKCGENYGRFASKICYELAVNGFVTVSGVAGGADSYALKGAILANGKGVAILPCGIDVDYSAASAKIKSYILRRGAVISEYPPGTPVRKYHFRQRNRLLSGISPATLVICAEKRSGTMITADYAAAQGKCIFALPGSPTDKTADGTNELLRSGAFLCRNSIDILESYPGSYKNLPDRETFIKNINEYRKKSRNAAAADNLRKEETPAEIRRKRTETKPKAEKTVKRISAPKAEKRNLTDSQKAVLAVLKNEEAAADVICDKLSLSFPEVIVLLQEMAIDGLIEEKSGGRWALKS